MNYKAQILRINNIREIENADFIKSGTVQGNEVIIGKHVNEGDLGLYFQVGSQISEEFCFNNNLFRDPTLNKDRNQTGFFDRNRKVKPKKIKGRISNGFWIGLESLSFIGEINLKEFDEIDRINDIEICQKFLPPAKNKSVVKIKTSPKPSEEKIPMFKEHYDTGYIGANLHKINLNDRLIITEKLHGTSFRVGNVKVRGKSRFFNLWPEKDKWILLNGTRRTIINFRRKYKAYQNESVRVKIFEEISENLHKGEVIYGEIVGYEATGNPIMPKANVRNSDLIKRYGKELVYSYGCENGGYDFFVYRIAMMNEDGVEFNYPWRDIEKRCKELNIKVVPFIMETTLEDFAKTNMINPNNLREVGAKFLEYIKEISNGDSSLDNRHLKEGVCVRVESALDEKTYKYKSFDFVTIEDETIENGIVDVEMGEEL